MNFRNKVIQNYIICGYNYKIAHEDNELEIQHDDIGKAYGEFADIEDEDHALEMPPLGLDAYGEDEGKRIYKILEDAKIDYFFYIHGMEIEPNVRGKGYGKQLLTALEREAKKHGIDAFIANASPMGTEKVSFSYLKRFYTSMGYKFLTIHEDKNGLIFKKV